MRIDYDQATDSLYIHLSERPSVDSDEVVNGVVLDYDAQGALVGIDVQHASLKTDIRRLAVSHMPLTSLMSPLRRAFLFHTWIASSHGDFITSFLATTEGTKPPEAVGPRGMTKVKSCLAVLPTYRSQPH
jgi:uncharacterized protein YuzE